jgi:MFS transporter, PPP family, 3-phenylpropionic acid transporter
MIAESVDEERTGAAQGAAFFATGIGMATVTLLSGPLYDRFGVLGFFAMVGVAAIGLVLGWLSAAQPHSAGSGGDTSEPR